MIDFGVKFELTIHLVSDMKEAAVEVTYECGVNQLPTVEQVNEAIAEAIKSTNKALRARDFRLKTLADCGFASEGKFDWPPRGAVG